MSCVEKRDANLVAQKVEDNKTSSVNFIWVGNNADKTLWTNMTLGDEGVVTKGPYATIVR